MSTSQTLLAMSLSFDGIKALVTGLYDRVQHDWWGSAYWAGVWVFGFILTFFLVRMLFTRWGEGDVTRKTLVLSLLAHGFAAMLSTTVIFGPGLPRDGGDFEQIFSIRRVVNEGGASQSVDTPGSREATGGGGRKVPGKSPVWDQGARFESQRIARMERPARETPAAEVSQNNRTAAAPSLPAAPAAAAEPLERENPQPDPERATTKPSRPADVAQSPIAEETAEARPEASSGLVPPARQSRGTPGPASGAEVGRRPRPGGAAGLPVTIDPSRGIAASTNAADPQATIRREGGKGAPLRTAGGTPKQGPVEEPGGDPTGTGTQPGAGSSASGQFSRIGRPSAGTRTGSGALERTRSGDLPARGSSAGGPGDPGAVAAARPSSGDGTGDGISPDLARSGSEGAIDKNAGKVPAAYRLRTSPQRKKIALDMGANEESERAVEASLQWLATHQHTEGYWEPIESVLGREPDTNIKFNNPEERKRSGFNAETGLTALAILAFLGKGYTHEDNEYAETVERALHWLISQQDPRGFLGGRANSYARMYCHGMATIALGEAYGMTKDPLLREPLARAVRYIVDAQNPGDGGWRYQPGQSGDMSMFGWQLMALKSAKTAGLDVPKAALDRAIEFLIASGDDLKARNLSQYGGLAAYRRGDAQHAEAPKPSMTAEALFCKQMLGIKRTNRATIEAVEYLLQHLPKRSTQDLYYWYYGTLAMYHNGGEPWQAWNRALRDNLVADQRTDGDFAGSWNPRAPWGDYGGRVFSTAISTLCLEVYYRFLPLYHIGEFEKFEPRAGK